MYIIMDIVGVVLQSLVQSLRSFLKKRNHITYCDRRTTPTIFIVMHVLSFFLNVL